MDATHVEGEDRGTIMVYALSTCGWCKKTKALLNELGVGYDYADVDLLDEQEKEQALSKVKRWNPACSFPSVVIDDRQCVVGFDERKIRGILGK